VSAAEVIVAGKVFDPVRPYGETWIFRSDFPFRYEAPATPRAGSPCEQCGQPFHMWMCSDLVWETLPKNLQVRHMCVGCFRKLNKRTP